MVSYDWMEEETEFSVVIKEKNRPTILVSQQHVKKQKQM